MSSPDLPTLQGSGLTLRAWTEADLPALLAILNEPDVAQWWTGGIEMAQLRSDVEDPEIHTFIIEVDGALAGLLQYHEVTDAQYRSAGMDIGIATAHQGRGHGTEALRTLARFLFDVRGHHRLTIDPAAANARAVATYRKVGFKPVGVMREYERGPDGTFHDGLLMDMLREELT